MNFIFFKMKPLKPKTITSYYYVITSYYGIKKKKEEKVKVKVESALEKVFMLLCDLYFFLVHLLSAIVCSFLCCRRRSFLHCIKLSAPFHVVP